MTAIAQAESILTSNTSGSEQIKNRLARLIESGHGRIIHGIITRTPEDSAFDQMIDGRPHVQTYHIQPQNSVEGTSYHGPTYIVDAATVESIMMLEADEVPARPVIWLPQN